MFKMSGFRLHTVASAVLVAGLVGFLGGAAFTDESDPSDEEMMKMMMELAQPGAQHESLAAMAGDWDVEAKMWMSNPEPIVSKASSTNRMILGGRYLQCEYSGVFGEMPFEGRGVIAFDNATQAYKSVWYDNFSTGFGIETGAQSDDGKTLTMNGFYELPDSKMPLRHVYRFEGKDKYVLTGYATMGEQEMKSMELTFTRKAAAAPAAAAARRGCCPKGTKGPGY